LKYKISPDDDWKGDILKEALRKFEERQRLNKNKIIKKVENIGKIMELKMNPISEKTKETDSLENEEIIKIRKAKRKNTIKLLPGDVVTYYYPNIGRVGHVGFLEKIDKDGYFITIEGNTTGGGFNRDGVGVFQKQPRLTAIGGFVLPA
jgi:translation initiation factor IF-1